MIISAEKVNTVKFV
jgi:hypothetical protein